MWRTHSSPEVSTSHKSLHSPDSIVALGDNPVAPDGDDSLNPLHGDPEGGVEGIEMRDTATATTTTATPPPEKKGKQLCILAAAHTVNHPTMSASPGAFVGGEAPKPKEEPKKEDKPKKKGGWCFGGYCIHISLNHSHLPRIHFRSHSLSMVTGRRKHQTVMMRKPLCWMRRSKRRLTTTRRCAATANQRFTHPLSLASR